MHAGDYNRIAAAIGRWVAKEDIPVTQVATLVHELCEVFESDNDRFDCRRFNSMVTEHFAKHHVPQELPDRRDRVRVMQGGKLVPLSKAARSPRAPRKAGDYR